MNRNPREWTGWFVVDSSPGWWPVVAPLAGKWGVWSLFPCSSLICRYNCFGESGVHMEKPCPWKWWPGKMFVSWWGVFDEEFVSWWGVFDEELAPGFRGATQDGLPLPHIYPSQNVWRSTSCEKYHYYQQPPVCLTIIYVFHLPFYTCWYKQRILISLSLCRIYVG